MNFLMFLKEKNKSNVHQKIAFNLLRYKIKTDVLMLRYKEFEEYKLLMKAKKIQFENYFKNAKNKKDYEKSLELFNDEIHRVIIDNKAKKLLNSVVSKRYNHLIDKRTIDLFKTIVFEGITRNELQDGLTKKIARYTNEYDFNEELVEFINKKINWNKESLLNKIKVENLNVNVLENNNETLFIKINDKKAAKRLGSQTWCITQDGNMYEHYTKNERTFYFKYDFSRNDNDSVVALIAENRSGEIIDAYKKNDDCIYELDEFERYNKLTYKMNKTELEHYLNKKEKAFYKTLLVDTNPFALSDSQEGFKIFNKINEILNYIEENDLPENKFDEAMDYIYKNKEKEINKEKINKTDVHDFFKEQIFFIFRKYQGIDNTNINIKKLNLLKNEKIKKYSKGYDVSLNKIVMELANNKNDYMKINKNFLKYCYENNFITKEDIKLKDNNQYMVVPLLLSGLISESEIKNHENLKYELKNVIKKEYEYDSKKEFLKWFTDLYTQTQGNTLKKYFIDTFVSLEIKEDRNIIDELDTNEKIYKETKKNIMNKNWNLIELNEIMKDNTKGILFKSILKKVDFINTSELFYDNKYYNEDALCLLPNEKIDGFKKEVDFIVNDLETTISSNTELLLLNSLNKDLYLSKIKEKEIWSKSDFIKFDYVKYLAKKYDKKILYKELNKINEYEKEENNYEIKDVFNKKIERKKNKNKLKFN